MTPNPLWHEFNPTPLHVPEVLAVYVLTRAFHTEVEQRHTFERYCADYAAIAAENQADLAQMQQELNLLQWFQGRRR
jgi:hypothetical protein